MALPGFQYGCVRECVIPPNGYSSEKDYDSFLVPSFQTDPCLASLTSAISIYYHFIPFQHRYSICCRWVYLKCSPSKSRSFSWLQFSGSSPFFGQIPCGYIWVGRPVIIIRLGEYFHPPSSNWLGYLRKWGVWPTSISQFQVLVRDQLLAIIKYVSIYLILYISFNIMICHYISIILS